jgi:hypothetical protein
MSLKYFALFISLLVAPLLSAETPNLPAEVFQELDQELTARRTDGVITGGQVAVRQNGKLLFSRSYGVVAVQSERAVDEKTLYARDRLQLGLEGLYTGGKSAANFSFRRVAVVPGVDGSRSRDGCDGGRMLDCGATDKEAGHPADSPTRADGSIECITFRP